LEPLSSSLSSSLLSFAELFFFVFFSFLMGAFRFAPPPLVARD
jgi:hypothetical protein